MIRTAELADIRAIRDLINAFAAKDLMLTRSLGEIVETLRDFRIAEHDGVVVGCAALHLYSPDMAEIKSVAVATQTQGLGLGRALVEDACREAAAIGLARVFVLTYQRNFFTRLGFLPVDRSRLPEKVWGECVRCRHFLACDEIAMWKEVGGRLSPQQPDTPTPNTPTPNTPTPNTPTP